MLFCRFFFQDIVISSQHMLKPSLCTCYVARICIFVSIDSFFSHLPLGYTPRFQNVTSIVGKLLSFKILYLSFFRPKKFTLKGYKKQYCIFKDTSVSYFKSKEDAASMISPQTVSESVFLNMKFAASQRVRNKYCKSESAK